MNNYNQEDKKVGLERHSLKPSQLLYTSNRLPYRLSQEPYPPIQSEYLQDNPSYPLPQPRYPATNSNFPPQSPITEQPACQGNWNNWMERPQITPNCPPGLEYLASIDQLLVYQKIDLLEIVTNFQVANKYSVHNILGQMVYHATEYSGFCVRNSCGVMRPFEMGINDNFGQEVIHFSRPLKCKSCCCFCCLQTIEVFSPPGIVIGTIEQNWDPLFPSFSLKNSNGDVILRIKGPFCTVAWCCSDVKFDIFYADGDVPVGKITKKWSGYVNEAFTNADNFGVSFPMDLDVNMKAILLGALFLIDIMYYEC